MVAGGSCGQEQDGAEFMSVDKVLPTPERMAKGDLVEWRATGRAMNQMGHDRALSRGVINMSQWVVCNKLRLCYEVAISPVGGGIALYGERHDGGLVEDWLNSKATYTDWYRSILREMAHDELIVVRAIVCYDMSLRDAARHLGARRDRAKQCFYDGIDWLEGFFDNVKN